MKVGIKQHASVSTLAKELHLFLSTSITVCTTSVWPSYLHNLSTGLHYSQPTVSKQALTHLIDGDSGFVVVYT